MRTIAITLALTLAFGSVALAGPKDKSSETLVDISSVDGNGTTWDNGTVSTKVKTGKCKVQIQFKNAKAAIEGQNVICLGEADVIADGTIPLPPPGAGNSVVTRGIVEGGKLKIKGNMAAVGCGQLANAISYNATTTCYQEDPNYNPAVECGNSGMIWIEAPLPGFKPDSLEGLCQGLVLSDRINPPSSPLLATQGASQPLQ